MNISDKKLKLFRPVPAEISISSPLGKRILNGQEVFHKGIDFACPNGTEVKAVADGECFRAGYENDMDPKQGYGLRVYQEIELDGKQFIAVYAHNQELKVKDGDVVKRGDIISLSGHTGHAVSSHGGDGAHLHFAIREKDTDILYDVDWDVV